MTADEIKAVLGAHAKWLRGEAGGGRAVLSRADLRGADLRDADLSGADLSDADLSDADLSRADLRGAVLRRAVLSGAVLSEADLSRVDLRGADLSEAVLNGAVLSDADLSEAVLRDADLSEADLRRADLSRAVLSDADLSRADLPHFVVCPEEGAFVAYKRLAGGNLAKLEIPADAKRTSSLVGRKCRAEYARVLALSRDDGATWETSGEAVSGGHTTTARYVVGEIVRPDSYDDDIRVECTHGIHFFITLREAREYAL